MRKNNYKGKGKGNVKSYEKDEKYEKNTKRGRSSGNKSSGTSSGNDLSWYVNNASMLKDVATISYANVLANPIPLGRYKDAPETLETPGVMVIELCPSIGDVWMGSESDFDSSLVWESAVNNAARSEWSFIRQKNSGARNYDAADLMIYHLAMDSAYMYWSWLVRVYGIMRTYSLKNKYYPHAILKGMGLSDDDITELTSSMTDFRNYINILGAQLSSYAVPKTLNYVTRHLWLYQNIFMDADNSKAQTYLFNPVGFFKFGLDADTSAGKLEIYPRPNAKGSLARLEDENFLDYIKRYGAELTQPILLFEDTTIMSGDIVKAYGPENIYTFPTIGEDYKVAPVKDESILSQIHNSNICGYNYQILPEIKQDTGISKGFIYMINGGGAVQSQMHERVIIDSRFETPEPGDVMYDTRLISVPSSANSQLIQTGSEFVTGYRIIRSVDGSIDDIAFGFDSMVGNTNDYFTNAATTASASALLGIMRRYLTLADVLSKFDWHPLLRFGVKVADDSSQSYVKVLGDVTNYAVTSPIVIEKLHTVALNSQFNLPYLLTSL